MKPRRDGSTFRPLATPRVVEDRTCGVPVLHIGDWVNEQGHALSAVVQPLTSERRPFDIREFPPAPAPTPIDDEEQPA